METFVLDIQRSSVHDGPGVRTSVFLKGCPLHCLWCHNPESQNYKQELSLNHSRCVGCGKCAEVCPNGVHSIVDGIHTMDATKCAFCGKCEEACLNQAIRIMGKQMTPQEVFEVVKKDQIFYECTGGGVTVSGGEALSHPQFCKELFSLCKENNIHTCMETSGFASRKAVETIAPYVDLFLFDWKVTDCKKALHYIGTDGNQILDNLRYLCSQGKDIILRCPIIPGVNNEDGHFEKILSLVREFPQIRCAELLPYHNFGVVKSENIGRESVEFEVPSQDEKDRWMDWFHSHGSGDSVRFS